MWFRIGKFISDCKYGNELFDSVKCEEILCQLKTIRFSSRTLICGLGNQLVSYTELIANR
jgi:hypothetical protein